METEKEKRETEINGTEKGNQNYNKLNNSATYCTINGLLLVNFDLQTNDPFQAS